MTTPSKELTSKVAIITGASGGIGRVVAKRLASDGFAITVHYSGNQAKAEAVAAEINNAIGKAPHLSPESHGTFCLFAVSIGPFYYQSLLNGLASQKQSNKSVGWALPLDPDLCW